MELYAKDLGAKNASERGLDHTEKFYLRQWYGDLVDHVTVHWGARLPKGIKGITVSSVAQTFGRHLYIASDREPGNPYQLILLAHELVHTNQVEQLGSLKKFYRAYVNGWVKADFDYFANDFERAAYDTEIRFANWLGRAYPNLQAGMLVYSTGSKYDQRHAYIPSRLLIPPQEYAVVCLTNQTPNPVHFAFRWGKGEFQPKLVQPGGFQTLWWALEGGVFNSPTLDVSFDGDYSEGRQEKNYSLPSSRSGTHEFADGKNYEFRASESDLDLFAE